MFQILRLGYNSFVTASKAATKLGLSTAGMVAAAILGVLAVLMAPIQWMLEYLFDQFPEFESQITSYTVYLNYAQPWIDMQLFFFLMMTSVTYLTVFTIIKFTVGLVRGGR